MPTPNPDALIAELQARHLLHQCTDLEGFRAHMARPRRLYNGFDPTADSLTIGNLVPIMLLRRFRAHGHTPVVLMGGATGRIGDPSGKDAERTLMTDETVEGNIAAQKSIFQQLLGDDVEIVDNHDWFKDITFLGALRDIGKHFSVNEMIRRDAVKNRLEREGHGISFTEFSYMLLQAYDFLYLFEKSDITVQTAGADQWGNIVSGVDLIRRVQGLDDKGQPKSYGYTAPLLTKADGGKFGKTESGAIWLSHKRPSGQPGTSPYAYYQFWLNTADADVQRYLLIFTDLEVDAIRELCTAHEQQPHLREAQRTLAREATTLLHGKDAMDRAEAAAGALFSGEVAHLDLDTINEVFSEVPSSEHPIASLAGGGVPLVDILAETTLCKSKREAREFLTNGAITINGRKAAPEDTLTPDHLLHASVAILRRGKKAWHVTRWR
ncbi:MAG: tyrosine--tRNA ligase [Phycisphaeraceae bacterium]|nr:MAG: tyrosine--tRNA ligase [Phycisphaeraceae bacterium]